MRFDHEKPGTVGSPNCCCRRRRYRSASKYSVHRSGMRRKYIYAVPFVALVCCSYYAWSRQDLFDRTSASMLRLFDDRHVSATDPSVSVSGGQRRRRNPNSPKVLYTVFAGRKNRLLLQEPYWDEMYKLGAIDEVHLWNYIPLHDTEENRINRDYLVSLPKKYPFLSIKRPSEVPMEETKWFDLRSPFRNGNLVTMYRNGSALLKEPNARGYSEYYKYYTDNPWDGVIIKADDDIVYINSTMVTPYVEYLYNHTDIFLLSASVVNQGFCQHFQQKLGGAIPPEVIPTKLPDSRFVMGAIHTNATMAYRLHRHFLASEENRRRFFIPEPQFVSFSDKTKFININFIAIRGDVWHETWEIIQDVLKQSRVYYDEGAITGTAVKKRGKLEGIYMPLVVAHASYAHHYQLHHEILTMWAEWAKRERADLYGNLLDDWVAPEPYIPPEANEADNNAKGGSRAVAQHKSAADKGANSTRSSKAIQQGKLTGMAGS
mmetsp:Transcript_7162/g.15637  ORF Transcript_7162/g.15637 Transcript_7162/m.15637 type:complete len:489 (-) Transcript_7162:127-1593(-)